MRMSTRTLQGLVLTVALNMAQAQDPQEPTQDGAAARRRFEVTSIKRANAKQRQPSLNILPGGRLNTTGTSLRRLIMFAYDLSPNQLSGTSGWMDSERYDVVAKPPEGVIVGAVGNQVQSTKANGKASSWTELTPGSEGAREIREMVQALLSERFQLKVHRQTKELPSYALVMAKNGPKLTEAKNPNSLQLSSRGKGETTFQGVPMSFLATQLTRMTDRTVLDRTGLTGSYDFTLNWTPGEKQKKTSKVKAGGGGKGASTTDQASGPSVFTALEKQIGLKLQSTKGPVEVLVVDHAQKPTEDVAAWRNSSVIAAH
jgi:uncharacterized protein (TIGR03435 family)